MSISIQASSATVKALHPRLQQAYLKDEVRLVRRTTVLIDLLVHHVPMAVRCERWGRSASCLYDWQRAFLLHGLDSVVSRHGGGRPEKLTPQQKKRLGELIEAGPLVVGGETACWTSGLIRGLSWREFGVLYNCQYVCTLLHNLGFRFTRPAWCRIISTPHGANTGSSRNGLGFCALPSDRKACFFLRMRPVLPSGAR